MVVVAGLMYVVVLVGEVVVPVVLEVAVGFDRAFGDEPHRGHVRVMSHPAKPS
jgi:hypothetical protein